MTFASKFLIVGLFTLGGATVVAASGLEEQLAAHGFERGGPVTRIRYGDIESWDKLDDRHVVVYAGDAGEFLVRFRRACKHLDPTLSVSFTASAGNVTTADHVTIEWENGDRKFCYITTINRLEQSAH